MPRNLKNKFFQEGFYISIFSTSLAGFHKQSFKSVHHADICTQILLYLCHSHQHRTNKSGIPVDVFIF